MKKKEFISNNCQLCEYSAKQYLRIKNKFSLHNVLFCINMDLTNRERQKRMTDKVKCNCFKLAESTKEEQLSDIREIFEVISEELNVIAQKLADINGTDE